jgi:hypothetical protein
MDRRRSVAPGRARAVRALVMVLHAIGLSSSAVEHTITNTTWGFGLRWTTPASSRVSRVSGTFASRPGPVERRRLRQRVVTDDVLTRSFLDHARTAALDLDGFLAHQGLAQCSSEAVQRRRLRRGHSCETQLRAVMLCWIARAAAARSEAVFVKDSRFLRAVASRSGKMVHVCRAACIPGGRCNTVGATRWGRIQCQQTSSGSVRHARLVLDGRGLAP